MYPNVMVSIWETPSSQTLKKKTIRNPIILLNVSLDQISPENDVQIPWHLHTFD